jgi:hypothetical protein
VDASPPFTWTNALSLCCYLVDTLPPLVLADALPLFSSTLADVLPHWSCSSSLLSLGIFGNGVSFCRFSCWLALLEWLGWVCPHFLAAAAASCCGGGCSLYRRWLCVGCIFLECFSFFSPFVFLCWPSPIWLHQDLFVNCFLFNKIHAKVHS